MQVVAIQSKSLLTQVNGGGSSARRIGGLSLALLLGTSILAYATVPEASFAANECGVPPPGGGTVTCTPAGNPYPGGVTYDPVVEDLTLVAEPGVVVTAGVELGTSVDSVDLVFDGATDTSISSFGAGRAGIAATTTDGDIVIISDTILTQNDRSPGISATSEHGDIDIESIGDISTGGRDSEGIIAVTADDGNVTIDSLSVTTNGRSSNAIEVRAADGDVTIDSDSVVTTGRYSSGIVALGASVAVTSGSVRTENQGSHAIGVYGPFGATVVSGFIATTGDQSAGILITSRYGEANVTSGTITTTGGGALGIFVNGATVILRSTSITTGGFFSPGIYTVSYGSGGISVTSGSVATQGDRSAGIFARTGTGNVEVNSTGTVRTAGAQSNGIDARGAGAVTIDSNIVVTAGDFSTGILVRQTGARDEKAAPTGEGDIIAEALGPGGGISIRSGSITTSGSDSRGIDALALDGEVEIYSIGPIITTGGQSDGIVATNEDGNIDIESIGGITTSGDESGGIAAYSSYDGDVTISSLAVATTGNGSVGIRARSEGGDVVIDSDSVLTRGDDAAGIAASGATAAVTSRSVRTEGASASGGILVNGATGATVISETVATAGTFSPGISIFSPLGVADVTSGTATTTGIFANGINAQGQTVIVRSTSVTTAANVSDGIYARSSGPGGTSVTSGSVTTSGVFSKGIVVMADTGDAEVISTGTVRTTANRSTGIEATVDAGSLTIDSNAIVTTGDYAAGIFVRQLGAPDEGTGGISIRSGSIATSGEGSPGIYALAVDGDVAIISTGQISTTGAGNFGILAVSRTGAVRIDSAGIIASGSGADGIIAVADTDLGITIRGLVHSAQSYSISTFARRTETVDIVAGGTVRGRVILGGSSSTVNNDGVFDAIGTSLFGVGAEINVFNNNGGGIVSSFNGAAVFDGLETFNNRGRVDLRDGAAGDTLDISGTYEGLTGARLGIDVDFTAGLADVLILGPATSSTLIDIAGQGDAFTVNTAGILVVDASAGTAASAFALAGGDVTASYIRRQLVFDAPNFNFLLLSGPGQPVFEWAELGEIGTDIWYLGADALSAQLESSRDGGGFGASGGSALAQQSSSGRNRRGFGFWVQGVLGDAGRVGLQTLGNQLFDVSYDQDYLGVQGGLDYQAGIARFGITFGAGKSESTFQFSGNRLDVDDKNVGAYVALKSRGGFFFNALGKMDWLELDADPGPGLETRFDGRAFGLEANLGVRFGLGNLFVEPSVGMSWVNTDFDDIVSGPATIAVEDVRSMRARAGLRIGGDFAIGGGTLSPFVGVQAYEELKGDSVTIFTLGQTLALTDEPQGSRAVLNLGTSFAAGAFEAFLRGDLDFAGTEGRSIRAGARLRF